MKKKSGFTFKQLLFSYLAVTKVMYWMTVIGEMETWGEFGDVALHRALNQDIMVIVVLVVMHFLEIYIFSRTSSNTLANLSLYLIGLAIFIGLITGYHFLLGLFVEVNIYNWAEFIISLAIMFSIISAVLFMKDKMKQKETEMYLPDPSTPEGKYALLKTLHEEGVLTQEEFDAKVALNPIRVESQ